MYHLDTFDIIKFELYIRHRSLPHIQHKYSIMPLILTGLNIKLVLFSGSFAQTYNHLLLGQGTTTKTTFLLDLLNIQTQTFDALYALIHIFLFFLLKNSYIWGQHDYGCCLLIKEMSAWLWHVGKNGFLHISSLEKGPRFNKNNIQHFNWCKKKGLSKID